MKGKVKEKINRLYLKENLLSFCSLQEILVLLAVVSPMIVRFNVSDNAKIIVYISTALTAFSLFMSLLYYVTLKSDEKQKIMQKGKNVFFSVLKILVIILAVEILTCSNIGDMKLPFIVLLNLISVTMTIAIFSEKIAMEKFLHKMIRIYSKVIIYSVIFSILSILFAEDIYWVENKKYLATPYILNFKLRQHYIGHGMTGRYASLFRNVNQFGEFAYLLFVLTFFIDDKKSKRLLQIIVFIALFLSKSRNATVSTIIFLLVYYVVDKIKVSKETYSKVVFWFFLLGITSFLIFSFLIGVKVSDIPITNGRVILWRESIHNFSKSPLYGLGIKQFSVKIGEIGASSHNSFYQLMGSGGIIYLSIYLYFLYDFFLKIYDNKFFGILFSFIVSSLFYQMFENIVLENHLHFNILLFFYMFSIYTTKINVDVSMKPGPTSLYK